MTYKQRQYSLKVTIEKWLKSVEVGKSLSPTEFSTFLAKNIMVTMSDDIRHAYTVGRLQEYDYIDQHNRFRRAGESVNVDTGSKLYLKDNGWTL